MEKKSLSSSAKWGMFFVSPWVIIFCVFTIYPLYLAIKYSFMGVNLMQPDQNTFVGLSNWIAVATSTLFWHSILNALYNQVIYIVLSMVIALVFAAMIMETKKFGGFFRTVYYLPALTGAVSMLLVYQQVVDPSGIIQTTLLHMHVLKAPISWENTKWLPMPILAVFMTWSGFGGQLLINLAGMSGIDKSIIEAAELDGAGWWQRFFKITLPTIKPQITFNFIMAIIGAFQVFTPMFMLYMTQGGPFNSGYVPYTLIYKQGFQLMQMGQACATGLFLTILILVATRLAFKFTSKGDN